MREFEARLSQSVDHLLDERTRYALAARRSVLGRTWPAICDQLLGHYEAVTGRAGRRLAGRAQRRLTGVRPIGGQAAESPGHYRSTSGG